MKNIIVITGPTATGKTEVAVKLAKKINGEIISADSRQVYKYLDIGTNKPSKKQLLAVKHHLIGIMEPTRIFSAGDFVKLANEKIKEIFARKKIPIIAGGTGLYIKALMDGLINIPHNKKIRRNLNNLYKKSGLNAVYKKLLKIDPETAKVIDRSNPRRVLRALEICLLSGRKFSELKKNTKKSGYNFLIFGLTAEKNQIYKKINIRVDEMIKLGLLKEVKKLASKYRRKKNNILKATIGYREIIDYINGKTTLPEAIELIKRNTRRYAKRQTTWFRKNKRILWITAANNPLKNILNSIKKSDIINH